MAEVKMIERAWEKKIEPLTVRISTAVRITRLSRSRIYELIQSGDLDTVKIGRATLIQYQSLKSLTGSDSASR
jgi:excisionase family DNA binding protein